MNAITEARFLLKKTEGKFGLVAGLRFAVVEVNRISMYPHWRAGFQPM